jgi:hypothetical protein
MLEAAGQLTEAVQLFRQAQDWDSVARAIKQHALTLFYQGRWQTINDWYSGMPTAIAASDTWLVYWRARALTAGDTLRARGLLEVAFTRFSRTDCRPALLGLVKYGSRKPKGALASFRRGFSHARRPLVKPVEMGSE